MHSEAERLRMILPGKAPEIEGFRRRILKNSRSPSVTVAGRAKALPPLSLGACRPLWIAR